MLKHNLIQYKHNLSAHRITELDFVYQEISNRMLDRLDYIKLVPQNVLDIGNGTPLSINVLNKRYPEANVYRLSGAYEILKQYRPQQSLIKKFFSKTPNLICASAVQLPLASQSIDIVWSNLVLPYLDDLEAYFKEIRRVLTLGGFFLVSGFGVDSLQQLREVGLRTYDFPDMHIIGDILVKLGFSNPVTDVEYVTIEYDDFNQLLKDIRLIGCGSASNRNLNFRRSDYNELHARFERLTRNGKIPLTLEVFYAHAWKDRVNIELAEDMKAIQFHPQRK